MNHPLSLIEDAGRLAALRDYAILDTVPEPGFDDLAHLAAQACDAPVALVSLVDRDRQWFKARVDFPSCETDLDASVCKFVLAEPDILQIADLTADPRTAGNPLVTGAPHIRFYAGAPLRTPDGQTLGSLCVIDRKPRPGGLTEAQADALRRCARQVMALLDLRRTIEHRDGVLGRQHVALRRERRLEVLADLSAKLLNATHPAQVLETVLASEGDSLAVDRSYIYEAVPGQGYLRLTHGTGLSDATRAALQRMPFGGPVCGLVAQRREPLIIGDLQALAEPGFEAARDDGLRAYAGYPIVSRGMLRGVVAFASTRTRAFDAETLGFFTTVARFLSLAQERLDGDAALRDADRRSRLAQEAGQVGTFEVDVASGMMQVSGEFCRLYGVPASPLYSTDTFEALVLPEDAGVRSDEDSRQAGTAARDVEYRIRRADDGALRWIARTASFVRDGDGVVVSMVGTVRDITERRTAQEALRESEERFRTILETVEAAFAIVEVKFDADDRPVDYRFVEANPAFERQAGVDLRGKWVTEFAPDLERFWFETYGRVARTGEPASFENYAEAFKRWFDVRAVRVGLPEARRIAILFSDVTERHEAAERLRVSEAQARTNIQRVQLALAAGAIIGTWFWDLPSDRFTVDEAFARSFGLDPSLGREGIPLAQIVATVHPDDQAGLADAIGEAIARGGAYAHQYRVRRADGHYYWIEANGRVDHGPDGTPLSFPGVLLDIEERRAAQRALRESEAHWRGLFERLTEGFLVGEVVRDAAGAITDWRYVDVNSAWGELVGLDPAEVVGRTLRQVIPDAEEAWVQEFAEVVRTGRGITFTRRVGVLPRWYEGRAFPLGPERFGVIFLDVTDRMLGSQRRDALLRLGDQLRDLGDRGALAGAGAEALARTLGVGRAGYGSVDAARETVTVEQGWVAPGLPSIAGLHAFRTYGSYIEDLSRGETVVVEDTFADPLTAATAAELEAVQTRAFINLPIMERGRFVGLFFALSATPRVWTEAELQFMRTVADRTRAAIARVEAEEQQTLLNRELSHRMKNTFAMVQAIATQTLRNISDPMAAREALAARLIALGKAHDILMTGEGQGADMQAVIADALVIHDDGRPGRFRIAGPAVACGARSGLALALMIHELATNAAKYGALKAAAGTVAIDWTLQGPAGHEIVTMRWREIGGPPVTPPTHRGFGSRLIERGLAGSVGGSVSMGYAPDGVTCTLVAPLVGFADTA